MWTISRKTPNGKSEKVRLLVGKEYIVGRKDCPVLIKEDPSISRKHAIMALSYDIANLGDVTKIPEVILTDSSKYGTSVNGVKISQPIKLKDGDEVLFGTHDSLFQVCYSPLVAITSCMENSKKKLLKKQIHKLGGHLVNEWKSGYINHLVMDGLVFTIKVIHALADSCYIVLPSWFDETLKAIETQQEPPAPKMFLPPLKEDIIKSNEPLFLPDPKRKTFFAGKTFYFLSNKQFKRTQEAIEMCHGKAVLLELSRGLQSDLRLVNDGCCLMMLDQKDREGLSADDKESVTVIMEFLKSNKKRPIPESELGLAILEMNQSHYCNPSVDAVPTITQNIVCQSLNVGLDELSQVYSPQHKQQTSEFKKPTFTADNSTPVNQSERKDSAKTAKSTVTSHTFTPPRSTELSITKEERRKVSATDTPESAMKSEKPKEILKVSPIPETMNISDEGIVFVAETPRRNSSKSDITSYFSTNKSREEVVSDSFNFDGEFACAKAAKSNKNDKESFPDGLSFETSEFHSKAIPGKTNQELAENEISQTVGKATTVPDSLMLSISESEFDAEPPSRKNKTCSQIPASKADKRAKTTIPDSLGLDSNTNDFNTEQNSNKRESNLSEQVAIPDSMGMDESYEENNKTSSQKLINANSATIGMSFKRRRMTEDEKDLEPECRTLPLKRMKNAAQDLDENGFHTKQSRKEENSKASDEMSILGTSAPLDVSSVNETTRKTQSNGFLSTKIPIKTNLPGVQKLSKAIDVNEESEFNEDDLPRNLIVVDVVSLVVRKPGQKKIAPVTKFGGKNFKKFKKQWYAGCDRRFPKIIGGSDLVVHQALSNMEHEDWFIEAREASQEQERRDRMEQELFMSDAGLPQRRRKAR